MKVDNTPGTFGQKVGLRLDWRMTVQGVPVIADAFHGEGLVWDAITPPVTVLFPPEGVDNRDWLRTLDLRRVDAVDLDAWGWPCDQLSIITERGWRGTVFATAGARRGGQVPRVVLDAMGLRSSSSAAEPLWDTWISSIGWRSVKRFAFRTSRSTLIYDRLERR